MKRVLIFVLAFFLLPIFNLTANAADPGIIPGVTVSPQFLTTVENGMTDTITVYLNSQPTGDVIIPISSSDPGIIAVDKSYLIFTPMDYSISQTVRFTSINNDIPDGKYLAIVILDPAESTDPAYDGMDPEDVSIIVNDDDPAKPGITPGVIVSPKTITMNENGSTATFTVCLNSRPTDNATITISSSDSSSITIDKPMVVFTITDYNIPQTVTVTSVDNDVADGKHQAIVIRIVATDPGNGAVGVPRNKIIRITFSEEIKEGYNFGEIKINKSGADMDFTYRIHDSNLILNIKGNIPYASLCTVTIPVGAVEGQYGNSLIEEHSISFTIKSK
ncbi:Ig-like domain-containing protein [Youngiibacter fragilis]|uniref:SbsA Ig-like domain-containing protein n=1 Tax=Youngiibacter fragilis 232.1 TaxID=994573 RepID=V7I4Y9_9CLOT|nr:Ig-like domain-containing protein [Youngiibacter fragilis]ETA80948.1 hypothetical protein T472_0209185 [Youngiibacter fragilis 232.1]